MDFSCDPDSLARWDSEHSWHPFTPMQDWCATEPVVLTEGHGAVLKDSRGREYLDGNSSIWTNLHGHNHPKINAAIRAQLDRVAHVSYLGTANAPASALAKKLCSLFPKNSLERVFFSDNGSTAIEAAIKMAAQFWQQNGYPDRSLFVAFDQAYHGDTAGAASLGGVPLFHDRFSSYHFPVLRVRSLEELASLPALAQGRIAGVVIEPLVQGVNRIHLWPKGMLHKLRSLCDASDTFLILDEVFTGFGRTGKMFACQHEEVIPDFLCLAKGITGGYLPLAATLTTQRVFNGFLGEPSENKTFFYGHSYTANPLGCAAALANLAIFEEENTLATIAEKSRILADLLANLASDCPHVAAIRQLGLIAGIDLAQPDSRPFPPEKRMGFRTCLEARKHGLLTRNIGDTITLIPPYCSTPDQLSLMLLAIRKGISDALKTP